MSGLSCLTFGLIVFCCYSISMSKPTRNETVKKVDSPTQVQQHRQLQSEAAYETRQKRSEVDFGGNNNARGEYKDFNELIEELDENNIAPVSEETESDNIPPLLYFMLVQKLKQLQNNERQLPSRRTPRLGRNIDFQLFDAGAATPTGRDFERALNMPNDYAVPRQFIPRFIKKSVQFKPRLGKRTQVCN